MPPTNYEYKSDFAKKYVAQGREEGREEGRAEATRRLLLVILEDRKLGPSDRARSLVETTTSPALLEAWVRAAVTADVEDDVFATPKPAP